MSDQEILFNKLTEAKRIYIELSIEHWKKYELFTWVWWANLVIAITLLVIWWKVVDRKRIHEIAIFGLIINVQASFLDIVGSELILWLYPIRMLPYSPMVFPIDFIVLPVFFMFIYQYFPKWKLFICFNTAVAAILAFILEPIAVLIKEYRLISWKFVYSFLIYILIAIIARLITEKILQKQQNDIDVSRDKNL